VEEKICPACVHGRDVREPIIWKLLKYESLIEGGCPVGRHELTDIEWIWLGMIRVERQKIITEEIKN
jgi:hypothetical protein